MLNETVYLYVTLVATHLHVRSTTTTGLCDTSCNEMVWMLKIIYTGII